MAKLRNRATYRALDHSERSAEVHDQEWPYPWKDMAKHRIITSFAPVHVSDESAFKSALDDAAASYRSFITQKHEPRGKIRGQLRTLASAAREDIDGDGRNPKAHLALGGLSSEAFAALMQRCFAQGIMLADVLLTVDSDRRINWPAIADACDSVISSMRGGDYRNIDLRIVSLWLCDAFEAHTGSRVTTSGDAEKPSAATRFARAFFAEVDPKLPQRTIDNAMDQARRARARKKLSTGANLSEPVSPI